MDIFLCRSNSANVRIEIQVVLIMLRGIQNYTCNLIELDLPRVIVRDEWDVSPRASGERRGVILVATTLTRAFFRISKSTTTKLKYTFMTCNLM